MLKSLLFIYALNSPEVKKELEGWFGTKDTSTFLHELSLFASAGCDVRKYDSLVEYSPLGVASVRPAPAKTSPKVIVDLTEDQTSEKLEANLSSSTKRKTFV